MNIFLNESTSLLMNDCKIYRDKIYTGILLKKFVNNEKTIFDMYVPVNKRKMLFTKNVGQLSNSANDLLYDSPDYLVNEFLMVEKKEELHISKTVYLGELLKYFNFNEELSKSDIKKIYKLFLTTNSDFFKKNYPYLPISGEDFETLKLISELSRMPSFEEIKKYDNSFKPKIKIYTRY